MSKYPISITDLFKEVVDKAKKELEKEITEETVERVIDTTFRIFRRLLKAVRYKNEKVIARTVIIPGLGMFKYMPRIMMNALYRDKKKKEYNIDDSKALSMRVYRLGWRLLRWTQHNGFIFMNIFDGEIITIGTTEVSGRSEAFEVFLNLIEERYLREGVVWNVNPVFTPANIMYIKGVLKYDSKGKYLGRYDSITEVCSKYWIVEHKLLKVLLHNKDEKHKEKRTILGFIWMLDDGFRQDRNMYAKFNGRKHLFKVSVLDLEGNYIIKNIGTILDAKHFVEYMGITKEAQVSAIKRVLDTDYIAYGYKWKREPEIKESSTV